MNKAISSLTLIFSALLIAGCASSSDDWRNWSDRPLIKNASSMEAEVVEADEVDTTMPEEVIAPPAAAVETAEVVDADPIFEEAE